MPGNASRTSISRPSSVVDPAAGIAGQRADHRADEAETDTTARPTISEMRAPGDQPRQDVAPQLVEPERMLGRRSRQPQRQMLRRRIRRDQPRPEQGGDDRSTDDDQADPARSLVSNARIEPAVDEIHDEIHADVHDRDQQDAALHQRVVAKR